MNTHVPSPQTRTATTTNAMSPLPPEKILKTTQTRMARMANVMGYLYFRINLFISWHFHDWRHVVLAVEDSTAGQIRTQRQLEVASRCRQPVGHVSWGSRVLPIAACLYGARSCICEPLVILPNTSVIHLRRWPSILEARTHDRCR